MYHLTVLVANRSVTFLKRKALVTSCLATALAGAIPSFLGLVNHAIVLSTLGFGLFLTGTVSLFAVSYRLTDRATETKFWFGHLLYSLGSFKLLSRLKYDIPEYVEGAFFLSIFIVELESVGHAIGGALSYVPVTLPTQVFTVITYTAIMSAIVFHYGRLHDFQLVAVLLRNRHDRQAFLQRAREVEGVMSGWVGILVLLVGAISLTAIVIHGAYVDGIFDRASLYVGKQYAGPPTQLAVNWPPHLFGLLGRYVSVFLVWGVLSFAGLMTLATLSEFVHLDTASVVGSMKINPYRHWEIKPITDMLVSFWLLTSSGLLILPSLTIVSIYLAEAGSRVSAGLIVYELYYYPVFLVSFFLFSSVKVRAVVSKLKLQAAKPLYGKLSELTSSRIEEVQLIAAKLSAIEKIPEGPSGTAFMQVFQVVFTVGFALANIFLRPGAS